MRISDSAKYGMSSAGASKSKHDEWFIENLMEKYNKTDGTRLFSTFFLEFTAFLEKKMNEFSNKSYFWSNFIQNRIIFTKFNTTHTHTESMIFDQSKYEFFYGNMRWKLIKLI